ncbi:FMN-binding protein [Nocardioides sp. R-C-SC26]|uniref:FMN-binding protein n=1 Tax=Nocardioides sp. R-C-SC26 TaxID=2870414 RepID=UPI001E5FF994|nr:FMN-binding protein [Nocardioides sp. R-C-SC26]
MRRIVLWTMSTIAALVLLIGYRTSTMGPAALASAGDYTAGTTTVTGTGPGVGTFAGDTVQTRWGPVQVELTLDNGTVVGATVLQHPTGNSTDEQVNSRALPILVNHTIGTTADQLRAHGVDMVSGATYTSEGYQQSLQAALDRAGSGTAAPVVGDATTARRTTA